MSTTHSAAARVFGERLRAERLRLGLSQEDVAHLSEMHVTNVGKLERGMANPSLVTIVRLAGALNVDPGSLLAGLTLDQLPARTHRLTAAELIRERKAREGR